MRDSPPDEARLCAGPLASIKVTLWPAPSRWCAVHAPKTPAPTTTTWLFDPSWAALTIAGDKATPPAAASSERRVSFIASADHPRWPELGGGGGGGGGGGHTSVARITEPSGQVCVAGGGGGNGGAGSATIATAGATENALRRVSPMVRGVPML